MQNFYYNRICDDVHTIEICYPNQTFQDLNIFLTHTLGQKECKAILNSVILGEPSYAYGDLTIIKRSNEIVNIKYNRNHFYIKKRVMFKNDYFESTFKYNFRNGKYQLKILKNEKGNICNVTEYFKQSEEILNLIEELKVLDVRPNININIDGLCIINGRRGILEISDEEISLYSTREDSKCLETIEAQRYTIFKKDTNYAIGYVMFDFRETNIAYMISQPYQGYHYASKALKLMIELIKENINFQEYNLYVRICKDNLASIKTAEACDLEKVDSDGLFQKYVVNPQKILTV